MEDIERHKKIEDIGAYIDNELSPLERVSVLKAMAKDQYLSDLETKLQEQKKAIKAAFLLNLLSE